jgi:DNA-binding MarR family transcriptional regulator
MHPVFFGVKMLHLRIERAAHALIRGGFVREVGVTPARLTILKTLGVYRLGLPRWKLVRMVGVSGPVVSRMLRALEELGYVRRSRDGRDKRKVFVQITALGAEILGGLDDTEALAEDELRHAVVTRRSASYDLCEEELTRKALKKAERDATYELQIFERFLLRGRKRLGCHTPFSHPWFVGAVSSQTPVLLEPLGTFDPPGEAQNGDARWYDPWSTEYRPDVAEAS